MNNSYRICLIVPPGYKHSSAFIEVAFLLKSTFATLGYNCDLKFNEFAPDRINIVLGGHLITFNQKDAGNIKYIPYQLEQLSSDEGLYSENLQLLLDGAYEVWDYSLENIKFLKDHGIEAKHLPVGYHEVLEQIQQNVFKDIDTLFYGSALERRKVILDKLTDLDKVNSHYIFGLYGVERDKYIARSKILLNIHHYNTKIFEAVRISYLLNNKCFIISEESTVYPYEGVDIPLVPYDEIIDTSLKYLSDRREREEIAETCYQQFRDRYSMISLLQKVIT